MADMRELFFGNPDDRAEWLRERVSTAADPRDAEIERLTAELAAANNALDEAGKRTLDYIAERKQLRAELAAAHRKYEAERVNALYSDDMRRKAEAELAAANAEKQRWWEAANSFDDNGGETLWSDIADEENASAKKARADLIAIRAELAAERHDAEGVSEQLDRVVDRLQKTEAERAAARSAVIDECVSLTERMYPEADDLLDAIRKLGETP